MARASIPNHELGYEFDRAKEVEDFDRTKAGVKGLLDSGILHVPRIFVHPPERLSTATRTSAWVDFPSIDFGGYRSGQSPGVVERMREACQKWGFFQAVNHGIPTKEMEEVLRAVRGFHEQPTEEKSAFYSRDREHKVRFYSNGNLLVSRTAGWRDSVSFDYNDGHLNPEELPLVCRQAISTYMEKILKLKEKLAEVASEALGLRKDFLSSTECMDTANLVCHYYPACPEPHLTLGAAKHSDPSFLTILLQDDTGGLQVLHQNRWVDVPPKRGALVVNVGDLMQLVTNAKFRSVEHRVRVGHRGPRVSAACFFYPSTKKTSEKYGPIKELLSENSPPLYGVTSSAEYLTYYKLEGHSALPRFELG